MTLIAFNIGMPKSGSSTLQNAFTRSGIHSLHWYNKTVDKYVGREIYKRHWLSENLLADFPGARAVTQADLITWDLSFWPQMDPAIIRKIAQQNPGCKFLLPLRAPEKIAASMFRWGNFIERLHKVGAPGLPPRQATNEDRVIQWIEAHFTNMREMFGSGDRMVSFELEDEAAPEIVGRAIGCDIQWWGQLNKTVDNSHLGFMKRPEFVGDPQLK